MGVAKSWKKSLRYGAASIAVGAASAFAGVCAAEPVQFDIEAAPLGDALRDFGTQAGMSVIFSEALVRDHAAPALRGAYEPDEALQRLLAGSNLEFVVGPNDNLIIREATTTPIKTSAQLATPDQEREEEPVVDALTDEPDAARPEETEPQLRAERVTVTGTSIRGFAPESSPLDVYTREDIQRSGVMTTEQFIRRLPQNSGAGSSEFAAGGLPNDINAGSNSTFGTGPNLRGLGSGSTLVLLNGNRIAPTSSIGDFVDLSLIPVSAIDRVDVLSDGASSVYGGDAVAGVINFVLRDDFEGGESAIKYGIASEGAQEEVRANQTLGTTWKTGNVLGAYEYYSRGHLKLSERPSIISPEATSSSEALDRERFDLMPSQKRHSAMFSVGQDLSQSIEFFATGLYSERTARYSEVSVGGGGVTSETEAKSRGLNVSGGVDYHPNNAWVISLDGTVSQLENSDTQITSDDSTAVKSTVDSDVWSIDLLATGDVLKLPGGTAKVAFGGHRRAESLTAGTGTVGLLRDGSRDVSALYAEVLVPVIGEANSAPGIQSLAFNLSGRVDDYSDFGTATTPKVGAIWKVADSLSFRASYSESFAPPALGRVGDLSRTGSLLPLTFLATAFGFAGEYPELDGYDLLTVFGVENDLDPQTSKSLSLGTNFKLESEARAFNVSVNYYDIDFRNRLGRSPLPGNLPAEYAPFLASDDETILPSGSVVFFPTNVEVEELISTFFIPARSFLGASLDNIGVINNVNVIRNLSSIETSGLDIDVKYSAESSAGQFQTGFNISYILEYEQQATSSTPKVSVLNTLYSPVDFKFRGNVRAASNAFAGEFVVNYLDSYKSSDTPGATQIDSWLTADFHLQYEPQYAGRSWLANSMLSLSINNIFDEPPPTTTALGRLQLAGYDPANADPRGRVVSIELSKRF